MCLRLFPFIQERFPFGGLFAKTNEIYIIECADVYELSTEQPVLYPLRNGILLALKDHTALFKPGGDKNTKV